MINVRGKLILGFAAVIVVSIASLLISLWGYNRIISRVDSIDRNKQLESRISEVKDSLCLEQQILSGSIINMENSADLFNFQKASIDKVIKDLHKESLKAEDKAKLNELSSLNKQYSDIFNNQILPLVVKEKKKELQNLYSEYKDKYQSLLDSQVKYESLVKLRLRNKLERAGEALKEIDGRTLKAESQAGILLKKKEKIIETLEALKDSFEETSEQKELSGIESTIGSIASELTALYAGLEKLEEGSNEIKALEVSINIKDIQKDIGILEILNSLLYWTSEKANFVGEASILLDDSFEKYNLAASKARGYLSSLSKIIPEQDQSNLSKIRSGMVRTNEMLEPMAAEIKRIRSQELQKQYRNSTEILKNCTAVIKTLEKSFKDYLSKDIDKSQDIKTGIMLALVVITLISLLLGMGIALILSINITGPIRNLIGLLSKAEKGDLTVRAVVKSRDEIGELGQKVNNVLDGQQKIVGQVISTNKDISSLKQKLSEVFTSSRENANKITDGLKEVAKTKSRKKVKAESFADVNELVCGVKGVSDATSKVIDDGMKAIEAASTGERSVEEAEAVIRKVTETVQQIASSIEMLEESSDKIGDITNTITEIATRTNLLALNAAIEAARAGQQGKGFTVLADEIRKLSDGSNKAAGEIKNLIKEIQNRVQATVDNMNQGVQGVEEGVEKICNVKANINDVIGSVRFVVESVRKTAEMAYKQSNATEELVKAVGEYADNTTETVLNQDDINKNLMEQAKTIKEIEAISHKLDEAYDKLSKVVEQVKI